MCRYHLVIDKELFPFKRSLAFLPRGRVNDFTGSKPATTVAAEITGGRQMCHNRTLSNAKVVSAERRIRAIMEIYLKSWLGKREREHGKQLFSTVSAIVVFYILFFASS